MISEHNIHEVIELLRSKRLFILLIILMLSLSGCMRTGSAGSFVSWYDHVDDFPEIPDDLKTDENGIPVLKVYDISGKQLEETDLETYVLGVVAGEMKNDWPLEALKAQAILARTFVLKFCDTKESKYEGADISTDISEAQAYAPNQINDRIRQAVAETEGVVMSDDGEYPYAWFFAHAGGKTELPSVSLDFKDEDPDYLDAVESPDSEKAPEDVQNWTATFSKDQLQAACEKAGLKLDNAIESVELGERGASGRVKDLIVNGKSVSAPSVRVHIGSDVLKSTLIDSVKISEDSIVFTGRGYGHGVGMSQWGAYALAEDGKNAQEIIRHYFKNIDLVKLW